MRYMQGLHLREARAKAGLLRGMPGARLNGEKSDASWERQTWSEVSTKVSVCSAQVCCAAATGDSAHSSDAPWRPAGRARRSRRARRAPRLRLEARAAARASAEAGSEERTAPHAKILT
jgi:hypothetical protein